MRLFPKELVNSRKTVALDTPLHIAEPASFEDSGQYELGVTVGIQVRHVVFREEPGKISR